MPPSGTLYVCKICPSLKKANCHRRSILANLIISWGLALMMSTMMTTNNNINNNNFNYINYIWGEFSWMYLYSKSSAHRWVLNSLTSFSIFIGVTMGSFSPVHRCSNQTVWYDMMYSHARFENLMMRSWFRTSIAMDFLTLPMNFSFFLFSSSGSLW